MSLSLSFEEVGKSFRSTTRRRGLRGLLFFPPPYHRELFSGLNFSISPGEKVLFLGPNGSGKTTVLKLAAGLMPPTTGSVRVEDRAADKVPRRQIGIMLSTSLLYQSLTGYQNLEYAAHLLGSSDITKPIRKVIRRWGIEAFVDDIVESYSSGQKALLALARATLMDPPLVLLDEPAAYLDFQNRGRLWKYLKKTTSTVLLTSQEEFPEGTIDRVIYL